jgi:beta-mannosidase
VVEKKQAVQVSPLSSKVLMQMPIEESLISKGMDWSKVFAVADLTVSGNVVSSNVMYLAPTFEISLPPAPLKTELVKSGDGYRLRISSPVLVRSVYVTFGSFDADLSDNYFDILPGQTAEIAIKTHEGEAKVRSELKVISLVDAFDANKKAGSEMTNSAAK